MPNAYVCDNCGGTFERYPSEVSGEHKFCGKECNNEYRREQTLWVKYEELENPDWIREKHHGEGLTFGEIADILGCSQSNVAKRAKEYGIEPQREKYPELADTDWLKEKHHEQNTPLEEIADIVGCTRSAVGYAMRRNDIEVRQCSLVNEVNGELSEEAHQVIEGELLGDGCIPEPRGNAGAQFTYGTAKEAYRDWLASWFDQQGLETRSHEYEQDDDREGWSSTMSYRFGTLVYHELLEYRNRWYPNGEKIVPPDFELTPLKLRHMHIGDGSYKPGEHLILYTDGFDDESVERLQSELGNEANVNTRISHRNSLIIGREMDRRQYFEYIEPLPEELNDVYGYKFQNNE